MSVKRFDVDTISKVERTPQGGMRIPARPTRAGVFLYRNGDGTERYELRPPEEVFKPDSLASLRGATVTDLHPDEGSVTTHNFRTLTIGHVGDDVTRDGDHVSARLVINDQGAIDRINGGQRKELSCGYTCDLDTTPGVYQGQKYDAIQRNVIYDHVAIGPEGWGRGGPTVAMRLDSVSAVQVDSAGKTVLPPPERAPMATVRIDGVDYEVGSAAHLQAAAKRDAAQEDRIATLTRDLEKSRGETAAATSRADAAEKAAKEEKARADKASDPKAIHALVKVRADMLDKARRVAERLGVRFDDEDEEAMGETDEQGMVVQILKMIDPDFDPKGKTPDFIHGYAMAKVSEVLGEDEEEEQAEQDALGEPEEEDTNSGGDVQGAGQAPPRPVAGRSDSVTGARRRASRDDGRDTRQDAAEHDPATARDRLRKDSRSAWETVKLAFQK